MAIYMKFEGIDGRVKTEGFEKWIELDSFQFNIGRAIGSGTGGQQREGSNPSVGEVHITKKFDESSPKLYKDALAGAFSSKVDLKFTTTTKNKVDTFLHYELQKCGITAYSAHSGGDNPMEAITLNFTNIMLAPSPLDEAGSPKAGDKILYDLLKMKAS